MNNYPSLYELEKRISALQDEIHKKNHKTYLLTSSLEERMTRLENKSYSIFGIVSLTLLGVICLYAIRDYRA
ncbi:MAG: hypothetical protein ACYCQJ_14400 [Nitrososphaerales archaeon]